MRHEPSHHASSDALSHVVAALACALPAVSQEAGGSPAYNIELVDLSRHVGARRRRELERRGRATANSIAGDEALQRLVAGGALRRVIPSSSYQLTEIESKLRSSGAYVPVAHVAWSQTASAWGTRAGFTLQKLGVDAPGLSGTVFLERGQYLHLGMTLTYADPSPPAGLGAASGTTFIINQSRRIRFYERNYYDHPAFGVIALVSPAQGTTTARAVGSTTYLKSLASAFEILFLPSDLARFSEALAGLQQRLERQLARWHQARHAGAQRHEAPRAGARVMHQQVAHALRNDLRILRGFLRRVTLRQNGKRPAFPTSNKIAAAAIGSAYDARDAPNAGITRSLVESLVVGSEIVDIEQA